MTKSRSLFVGACVGWLMLAIERSTHGLRFMISMKEAEFGLSLSIRDGDDLLSVSKFCAWRHLDDAIFDTKRAGADFAKDAYEELAAERNSMKAN